MMPRANTTRDRVLAALRQRPMTARELATAIGAALNSVQCVMTDLKEDLLVHAVGSCGGAVPTTYALGAGDAPWQVHAMLDDRDEDHFQPRRSAPDVRPFRDEYQTWFFGQPGQETQHGAR